MTSKRDAHNQRTKEKRDSRIKDTQRFIIENTSFSLLNNQKWYRLFEWIENNPCQFKLKTLLSSETRSIDIILELEKNALLLDNSGDFTKFLEIEKLVIRSTKEIKTQMALLNIEFEESTDHIEINAYRK